MKRVVLLTATVLLAMATSLAGETARFKVPFAFVGFDSEFPAGDYTYTQNAGIMPANLVNEASQKGAFLATRNSRPLRATNAPTLIVFERHGDLYVLREFHSASQGMVFSLPLTHRRSALVQSYITQNGPGERIVIAASR